MARTTVLVVDDDAPLRELVAAHLRREGYAPEEAASGEMALAALGLCAPAGASSNGVMTFTARAALVILDIMLGGLGGLDVLRTIRRSRPELPVIILSARGEERDKVLGLGLGADDYVSKPFSPAELMARIKARLRRVAPRDGLCSGIIEAGPFRLDLAGCVLYKDGKPLELSARELALMRLFMESPGRVFTKAQIYQRIWEGDFYEDNTVMVHVSRLRDKVEDDSGSPRHIVTMRGLGYKLVTVPPFPPMPAGRDGPA